jgi:hypothetical protein
MQLALQTIGTKFQTGGIKGYDIILDQVRTHYIFRYIREENSSHRIDIFTKNLTAKALYCSNDQME